METYKNLFLHTECNALNIYRSEKCFEQKL
jgi:hypothetical protein